MKNRIPSENETLKKEESKESPVKNPLNAVVHPSNIRTVETNERNRKN